MKEVLVMNNIVNLSIFQLASAYIFVIIVLLIVKVRWISRDKDIII